MFTLNEYIINDIWCDSQIHFCLITRIIFNIVSVDIEKKKRFLNSRLVAPLFLFIVVGSLLCPDVLHAALLCVDLLKTALHHHVCALSTTHAVWQKQQLDEIFYLGFNKYNINYIVKGEVHFKMKISPWFTHPQSHPWCIWHSSFRRIHSELY